MIDFAKLADPAWQAQVRAEEEARQEQMAQQLKRQRQLIDGCWQAYETLPQKERQFVSNCQRTLGTGLSLSEPQEKWATDIAARVRSGQ